MNALPTSIPFDAHQLDAIAHVQALRQLREVSRAYRGSDSLLSSLASRSSNPWAIGTSELNPLSQAEKAAMVEKQVKNHPPLQVCYPGHRPHMYRAAGNCEVLFYVECSQCKVQSLRRSTADAAAAAWAHRDVFPIVGTANHAMVAA